MQRPISSEIGSLDPIATEGVLAKRSLVPSGLIHGYFGLIGKVLSAVNLRKVSISNTSKKDGCESASWLLKTHDDQPFQAGSTCRKH